MMAQLPEDAPGRATAGGAPVSRDRDRWVRRIVVVALAAWGVLSADRWYQGLPLGLLAGFSYLLSERITFGWNRVRDTERELDEMRDRWVAEMQRAWRLHYTLKGIREGWYGPRADYVGGEENGAARGSMGHHN